MSSSLDTYAGSGFNVAAVMARALNVSAHSWEYGTAAQALLELRNPQISVFGNPFPHDKLPTSISVENVPSLTYVKPFIRLDNDTLIDGDGESLLPIPSFPSSRLSSLFITFQLFPVIETCLRNTNVRVRGKALSVILHHLVFLRFC